MITYTDLKDNPKEFLAATGLTPEEFLRLLPAFAEAYLASQPQTTTLEGKPRQRRTGAGAKGILNTIEDKLLFILVYQKTYPLQTMHGLCFGLSQSQANYWIHRLLPILRRALEQMGMVPARDAGTLAARLSPDVPADLLLDSTERRRQRPQDESKQSKHYSGKKKTHTDKNLLLVNAQTQRVEYLGPSEPGSVHDKKLETISK
ncbi:MAG: transposase [Anaerolineae bacterium]|nr:transposase [Anaerolineae bacterium]